MTKKKLLHTKDFYVSRLKTASTVLNYYLEYLSILAKQGRFDSTEASKISNLGVTAYDSIMKMIELSERMEMCSGKKKKKNKKRSKKMKNYRKEIRKEIENIREKMKNIDGEINKSIMDLTIFDSE